MAQAETKELSSKLTSDKIAEGVIRPYDKVTIEWTKDSAFKKKGASEEVHPALAEKLVEAGKAKVIDVSEDTSGKAKLTTEAELKAAQEKVQAKDSKK